jgi:tetratricopeptide (TPR) repeat protein
LGLLYADQGKYDLATDQLRASVHQADALLPKEPTNAEWLEYAFRARLLLARTLLLSGNKAEAAVQTEAGCRAINSALGRKREKSAWLSALASCWSLQARVAMANGNKPRALSAAQAALNARSAAQSGNSVAESYVRAGTMRLYGDVQELLGNGEAARAAWQKALAQLPAGLAEQPEELAQRAAILQRLGRSAEAQPLSARLNAIGYRLPV